MLYLYRSYGLSLLLLLIAPLCSGQTNRLPAAYTGRQLRVGSGGGFSGATTTYYLLDNGRLFRQTSADTVALSLGQLTTRTTTRLFNQVEKRCRIRQTHFNHPGNLYQFVGWQRGQARCTVTWASDVTPPAGYEAFYQQFLRRLPSSQSTPSSL